MTEQGQNNILRSGTQKQSEMPRFATAREILPDQMRSWLSQLTVLARRGEGKKALVGLATRPPPDAEKVAISTVTSAPLEKIIEPEATAQPSKYSAEREALGLGEEKSLQQIARENERQRKEVTDAFIESKKMDDRVESQPAYEEKLQQGSKKVESAQSALPWHDRAEIQLKRARTLLTLLSKGVQNPDRVLQILEAEAIDSVTPRLAKLALINAYTQVQKNVVIDRLHEVGDVSLLCERMHQLGADFSLKIIGSEDTQQIVPMLKKLVEIPKEQYVGMSRDLEKYRFLFPLGGNTVEDHKAFIPLIEFMSSNEQITSEQKKVLDMAHRIYLIGSPVVAYREYSHPILSKRDISDVLARHNNQRWSDELVVLEQLVVDLREPGSKTDDIIVGNYRQTRIYENVEYVSRKIEKMSQEGDLHTSSEVIRSGFTIGNNRATNFVDEFQAVEEDDHSSFSKDIQRSLKIISDFYDKVVSPELLLFLDIQKLFNREEEGLSIGRSELVESIITNTRSSQENLQKVIKVFFQSSLGQNSDIYDMNKLILKNDNGLSVNNIELFEFAIKPFKDKMMQLPPRFYNILFQKFIDATVDGIEKVVIDIQSIITQCDKLGNIDFRDLQMELILFFHDKPELYDKGKRFIESTDTHPVPCTS
ncbi:MAG: hypothetical protein WCO06_02380 [Candidatus Roizmanbacteria bacterium]